MDPRFGAFFALVGCLVTSNLGRAAEPSVDLTWTGPADCQDDGTLEQEIERIIGDSADADANESIRVRAKVERQPDGNWLVQLQTQTGAVTGERTLVGATCAELRRATALIVALMINPNVRVEPSPAVSTPPKRTDTPPPRPVRPPAPEPLSPAASTQEPLSFWLGAGLMGGIGVLPGASAGVQLAVGLELGALVIELNGGAWLPRDKQSDDSTSNLEAGGEFDLQEANLFLCYRAGDSASLGACAGGGARHMSGTGFGVSDPGEADGTWAAFVARVFADLPLSSRWSARPSLNAEIPFRPPTFTLAGVGDVHTPRPVAAHLELALRFRF